MEKLAFDIFDKINIFKINNTLLYIIYILFYILFIINYILFIINSFYDNFILCSQNILHAYECRNQSFIKQL